MEKKATQRPSSAAVVARKLADIEAPLLAVALPGEESSLEANPWRHIDDEPTEQEPVAPQPGYSRPVAPQPAPPAVDAETEAMVASLKEPAPSRVMGKRKGGNPLLVFGGLGLLVVAVVVLAAVLIQQTPNPSKASNDPPPIPVQPPLKEPLFKPGQVVEYEIGPGVKMKFCWIPDGEAQLGSPKAERDTVFNLLSEEDKKSEWWIKELESEAEEKRGKFKSNGFWLGKYEVTQGEWEAVTGNNRSYFSAGGQGKDKVVGMNTTRLPMENVSWDDCSMYIAILNDRLDKEEMQKLFGGKGRFKLPTEDEWEYACRGGKGNGRAFYFGNIFSGSEANIRWGTYPNEVDRPPGLGQTSEVGRYEKIAPHPWGLCDMHGNVWEWCNTWFDREQKYRVLRGGSWDDFPWLARAACRGRNEPGYRSSNYGFRVCFPPGLI